VLPWNLALGLAITLVPIVAGVVAITRMADGDPYGGDALRVVTGILAFFVLLDVAVGLGGRYDLTVGALVMAFALWRLSRRDLLTRSGG
jgi:hypothetical protein